MACFNVMFNSIVDVHDECNDISYDANSSDNQKRDEEIRAWLKVRNENEEKIQIQWREKIEVFWSKKNMWTKKQMIIKNKLRQKVNQLIWCHSKLITIVYLYYCDFVDTDQLTPNRYIYMLYIFWRIHNNFPNKFAIPFELFPWSASNIYMYTITTLLHAQRILRIPNDPYSKQSEN